MKKSKITALFTVAALLLCSCAQNEAPAVSTTAEHTTATAASSAQESTPAKTTAAETTAAVTSETTTAADIPDEAEMIRETLGGVIAYTRPGYMVKEETDDSHSYELETDDFVISIDINLLAGSGSGTVDMIMETADVLKEKVEDSFPNCLASNPEKIVAHTGAEEVLIDYTYKDEYEGVKYDVTGSIVFIPSGENMVQADFVYMDISDNGENYEKMYYDFLDIIYSVELTAPETSAASASASDNAEQPIYDSDPAKHPFRLGVWLVKSEPGSEYPYEAYYCFDEGGHGGFLGQDAGIGMNYTYEMVSEDKVRFEVGMEGEYSYSEIIEKISDDCFRVKGENSEIAVWTYLAPPTPEFSFYDNNSLGEMAKYYYGVFINGTVKVNASVSIRPDGLIGIKLYDPDVSRDGSEWLTWFYVDRQTGKGHDIGGEPIDLTQFAGSWADMPEPHHMF